MANIIVLIDTVATSAAAEAILESNAALRVPVRARTAPAKPPLQRIHPDSTYAADAEAKASLEYWRTRPTGEILNSLKPGGREPLITKPDGRMMNGNTRTKVLEERGHDINSLPREVLPPDPLLDH